MGNATTRSLERVAAAMGALESAPVQFQPTCDVTRGGVLLALPALLAVGLLHYTPEMYQFTQGILWDRQHLPLAGIDGVGSHSVAGAAAVSSSGRMGQTPGSGPNPRSAHPAGEAEGVVRGLGPSLALERGVGQGMDRPANGDGTVFLLRRSRARLSRRTDAAAPPLCGPRTLVSAGHHRLLDQCHGWPALPIRE